MLSFLLQCCCPRRRHRVFTPDSVKYQQMIYSIDAPYIPTTSLSFYDMSTSDDDSTSDSSVRFLPVKLHSRSPSYDEYPIKHDPEIQTLPGPTITIINMAAERFADELDWETADPFETLYNSESHRSSSIGESTAKYIIDDQSLLQKTVNYEKPPDIHLHPSDDDDGDDDNAMASEITGYDSESIDDTMEVFTSNLRPLESSHNDGEYQTAGVDEIELLMKDLIHAY